MLRQCRVISGTDHELQKLTAQAMQTTKSPFQTRPSVIAVDLRLAGPTLTPHLHDCFLLEGIRTEIDHAPSSHGPTIAPGSV